jgi:hypothetical protein
MNDMVKSKVFRMTERERDAIASCLVDLDQARIALAARDHRDGKDDRIATELEHCHDGIHRVLDALKPED